MQGLVRAVRARQIHRANNEAFVRAIGDLKAALDALLAATDPLLLKVRPDALFFDDASVLDEPDPVSSIPFLLYRDGLRRLELRSGIEASELVVLVEAITQGFLSRGLDDDVVSVLWRHDLEHVRYVVVDANIADLLAESQTPTEGLEPPPLRPLELEIRALLAHIYGPGTDDVGQQIAHVDAIDLPAKAIAHSLDPVDEIGAEFQPARVLDPLPAYLSRLKQEAVAEDDQAIAIRAAASAFTALANSFVEEPLKEAVGDRLLQMLDATLMTGALRFGNQLLNGLLQLANVEEAGERPRRLLEQAMSETRLRPLAGGPPLGVSPEQWRASVRDLLRAGGRPAVPAILALFPVTEDPEQRAVLADLVVELGVDDLAPLEALLGHPQAFVARDALYVLARLGSAHARQLLASAASHPAPPVREALMTALAGLPVDQIVRIAVPALADPAPEVAIAAARVLGNSRDPRGAAALEAHLGDATFLEMSLGVKQAFVAAYALAADERAVALLARFVKDGDGMLVKKEKEEMAIAAAQALGFLRTSAAISILEKASRSMHRRLREAAKEALRRAGVNG